MGFERIRMLRHLFGGAPGNQLGALDEARSLQAEVELRALLQSMREGGLFDQALMELPYAVIDTETTGFSPQDDVLLSVGAVVIDPDLEPDEGFHSLVAAPGLAAIPPAVERLTGISQKDVSEAPALVQVLPELLRYLGDRVLVAHHAAHDVRFLNAALRRAFGVELDRQVLDTGKIAMLLHDFKKYPSLDMLVSLYDVIPSGRHTALGDAKMTAVILRKQLTLLGETDTKSLGQLWEKLLFLERRYLSE